MTNDTYQFNENFERKLVAHLIRDEKFFARNVGYVREVYFKSAFNRDIWVCGKSFLESQHEPITEIILQQEITKMFYNRKKLDVVLEDYFDIVAEIFKMDISHPEYVEDLILEFARCKEIENILSKGLDLNDQGKDLSGLIGDITKALEIGKKKGVADNPKDLWEIMGEPDEENNYIVNPIFQEGDKSILIATWKLGKTLLDTQAALCISKPMSLFGFEVPRSRNVLYVRFELKDQRFKARLQSMVRQGIRDIHHPFEKVPRFHLYRGFDLTNKSCADWLYRQIDASQVDFLILEPMYKMFNLPLNKPESSVQILRALEDIQVRFPKIHIHVATHERRMPAGAKAANADAREKAYGPFQLYADFDWQLYLSSDGDDTDPTFEVKFMSNDVDVLPLKLKRNPTTLLYEPIDDEKSDRAKMKIMADVLRDAGKPITQIMFKQRCQKAGVGGKLFLRLLTKGIDEKIWLVEKQKQSYLYRLP